jgi:hypothetical protein
MITSLTGSGSNRCLRSRYSDRFINIEQRTTVLTFKLLRAQRKRWARDISFGAVSDSRCDQNWNQNTSRRGVGIWLGCEGGCVAHS